MCAQASRDLGILPSAKILAPPSGGTWCFAHGGCDVRPRVSGFPRMLGSPEQKVIPSVDYENDPWLDPSPRSCSVDWELVDLSWWWYLPLRTFRRSGLVVSILFHMVLARKGPTASQTCASRSPRASERCFKNPYRQWSQPGFAVSSSLSIHSPYSAPSYKLFSTVSMLLFLFYRFCVNFTKEKFKVLKIIWKILILHFPSF